ncbi:cupin domain-containing protein [Tardiphaga sp.]|uniref:cupin domain-containing protein n=1 Tax=Tardiphaga sp. TaxID=1926292 RepID=UPI0026016BCF|nr:cupin domain-containing protein [Tardiphaga sp.]MDB5616887.1 hypothetical protein [Tardiphaga sp.]
MPRLIAIFLLGTTAAAHAQVRTELKWSDLTGTNMEIVAVEVKPGEMLARHVHPGEEIVYVLEGATLELPDGTERPFPAGAVVINKRDIPHAGFKIAGDKVLKMLNVFVVDKGKPLTEAVK